MPSKIRLKRSTTASSVPTGLEAGEIAVNITDKRLFVGDGTNSQELTRRAASTNGNRVQLSGATGQLADDGAFTFDPTTDQLDVGFLQVSGDSAQTTVNRTGNATKVLNITQESGGKVALGDYSQSGNGTRLEVEDAVGEVRAYASTITLEGTSVNVNNLKAVPFLGIAGKIALLDADSSHSVTISCPTTVTANVTLTLPSTAGSNDQVLTTNGSGTLSWTSKGGFTPTQNEYTTSGTSTVTIPSGCTSFRITCIGGGGGGGGGACYADGTAKGGGGGGGGGGLSIMQWRVSDVGTAGSTVLSISVGAGGTGGAGKTANLSFGDDGVAGNTTSVSRNSDSLMLCSANGGRRGGGGGATTAGVAGAATDPPCTFAGGSGGAGNYNSVPTSGTQAVHGPAGGGGGGGTSAAGSIRAGANGFRTSSMLSTTLVSTGGAASDTGVAGNGAAAVEYLPGAPGGGGSGGGSSRTGTGGNGGAGFRGGGGGGGGAGANPGGSGAGGAGGAGYVRIEWF